LNIYAKEDKIEQIMRKSN